MLDKGPWAEVRRPASLRQLVNTAKEHGLIQLGVLEERRLMEWMRVRNEVVHTTTPVSPVRRVQSEYGRRAFA